MSSNIHKFKKLFNKFKIQKRNLLDLERLVRKTFNVLNSTNTTTYLKTIITNIIYNEKTHIVATFKDYLILDDLSEFLKRYYTRSESSTRLPKFFEYYETYSKIYPNYTSLPEGKYIYRNIQKKQRMIDLQEKMELEAKINQKAKKKKTTTNQKKPQVFSTEVYDSIINDRNNEDFEILFGIKNLLNAKEEQFDKNVNVIINHIEKYEKETNIKNDSSTLIEGDMSMNKLKAFNNFQNGHINQKGNIKNNSNCFFNHKSNGSNTERGLMEKIELTLFKTKKVLASQRRNKQRIDFQSFSFKNHLYNNDSNQYIPIAYKENSSYHDNHHTPSSERCYYNNNNKNSISRNKYKMNTSSKGVNSNKGNLKHNHHNSHHSSNIIYIINQNPKFTTQVNVYSNNHYQGVKGPTNKNYNLNIKQLLNSYASHSNPKTKSIAQIGNSQQNIKMLKPQLINSNGKNQKVKKRNYSANFSNINGGFINMLKTARDFGYKEGNLLKNNRKSLKYSPQNDNFIKKSNNNNKGMGMGHKEESITLRNSYRDRDRERERESSQNFKMSRNIERQEKSSNGSNVGNWNIKNNNIRRNDSMNKIGFIEENFLRSKIKGIKIKEFNKIFSKNGSNFHNKKERQINKLG